MQQEQTGARVAANQEPLKDDAGLLLTPVEAAAKLKCRPQTLAAARCNRTGTYADLLWKKHGSRVFYSARDIQIWLEQQPIRGGSARA